MSVKAMAHVFGIEDARLDSQNKFVLLAYVDHADEDGYNIYPAVATVARKTGLSCRTIQRRTRQLEELGLLVPDGCVYLSGTRGTGLNRWRYNWNWADMSAEPERVSDCRPYEKRVTENAKRVTTVTKKGDIAVSPEPSLTIHNHPMSVVSSDTTERSGKRVSAPRGGNGARAPTRTEGQKVFLELFGAKRFKTSIQARTIDDLEKQHGIARLTELAEWAAKQGMSVGRAVIAIEGALKKQSKNGSDRVIKVKI